MLFKLFQLFMNKLLQLFTKNITILCVFFPIWHIFRDNDLKLLFFHNFHTLNYSPNGRFLVQETFPKTLPRFVLILIYQRWQHRLRIETKNFVSPHLIGLQFLANQHETNQRKSAALIGLFHATSSVLPSVES